MQTWRRLVFHVRAEDEETLIACLHEKGTLGIEVTGPEVRAWFSAAIDPQQLVEDIRREMAPMTDAVSLLETREIQDGRWHERWVQKLAPIRAGRKFLILPGPAGPRSLEGRIPIRLTPGRAFGTGEHETTRGCLALLERIVTPGCSLLDLGTGSGILAIAALRLGAGKVVAVDHDEEAVRVARQNARINNAEEIAFAVCDAVALIPHPFDYLAANLHSTLLEGILPGLVRFEPNALLLSGILAEEEDRLVETASLSGFGVVGRITGRNDLGSSCPDEWVTLHLERVR